MIDTEDPRCISAPLTQDDAKILELVKLKADKMNLDCVRYDRLDALRMWKAQCRRSDVPTKPLSDQKGVLGGRLKRVHEV